MTRFLIALVLAGGFALTQAAFGEDGPPRRPCDFPTKPGRYQEGVWEYVYKVRAPGTRSETRTGILKQNGKEVSGEPGQVLDTPLGKFKFHETRYDKGWLNTLTYDRPVFPDDKPKAHPCDFPTKLGTYRAEEWEYTYEILAPGTRSETRIGTLKQGGKEVQGKKGDVKECPLGRFKYHDTRYNRGWLNTLTYDKPVFPDEGPSGDAPKPDPGPRR